MYFSQNITHLLQNVSPTYLTHKVSDDKLQNAMFVNEITVYILRYYKTQFIISTWLIHKDIYEKF